MADQSQDHLANLTSDVTAFTTLNYDGELVFICSKEDSNKFGNAAVPVFFYVVFAVSLLGNGLILFLLLKFENIKTVTNLFIFNLVVSDLLFTISLPFWGYYQNHEWIFRDGLCKVVSSVFYLGFYSSILFLTMMTVDRYMAVVHAIYAARTRKLLYVYLASAAIWAISLLSTIPKFVLYGTRNDVISGDGTLCVETGYEEDTIRWWKMVGYCQQLVMFFLIPLGVILYCYTLIVIKLYHTKMHNKDKALKLILIIVLAFFICWTPYNVVLFLKAQNMYKVTEDCNNTIDYVFIVCRNVAYFHCCVNPFFYTFIGTKFRRHLASIFGNWIRCGMRYRHPSLSSRTSEYSPQTIYE